MPSERREFSAALLAATGYFARGWSTIPVPYRSKAPVAANWQQMQILESDVGRYFSGRTNVGVLLGKPSRWLVDVDLDHPLAIQLAARYLRATRSVFGRRSKPRSHWLYYATTPVATRQWRVPGTRRVIVELRSTGGQTVFPRSVHPSGELIQWDNDGEPARIDPTTLQQQLEALHREVCHRLGAAPLKPHGAHLHAMHRAPMAVIDRARKYLAKLPPAISGQGGHDATFYAACTLIIGFGLERGSALALLRGWNEACQPPWSERELAHKVDDALKQPGWRGYLLARPFRLLPSNACSAIERSNRHAIEHRRKARRSAPA